MTMLADAARRRGRGRRGARCAGRRGAGRRRARSGPRRPRASRERRGAGVRSSTRRCSAPRQPAEEGKLIVLASGPEDVRERVDAGVRRGRREDAVARARPAPAAALKLVLNTWLLALTEGARRGDRAGRGARRRPADVPRHDRRRPDRRALREHQGQADDRARLPAVVPARARAQGRAAGARGRRGSRGCGSARWRRSPSRWTRAVEAGHGEEDMAATIQASRA